MCNYDWPYGELFLKELKSNLKSATDFNLSLITLNKNTSNFDKMGTWSSQNLNLEILTEQDSAINNCENKTHNKSSHSDSRFLVVATLLVIILYIFRFNKNF